MGCAALCRDLEDGSSTLHPGMVFLPPTTDFPPDPEPLDRELLNSTYRELRSCYASSMRSRAQHRRLANKAKDETTELKQRILALASRDLPNRKELFEILEIVTTIVGDIEDVGDDLVKGYGSYKTGRHTFQGGGRIGNLIRSVIHFINRWGLIKDQFGDLKKKQRELIDKTKGLLPPLPPDDRSMTSGHQGARNGKNPDDAGDNKPAEPTTEKPMDTSQESGDNPNQTQGGTSHG